MRLDITRDPRAARIRATRYALLLVATTLTASLSTGAGAGASSAPARSILHTAVTQTLKAAQSGQAQMKTISCASSADCIAIGSSSTDQGVITYSTNAGASWSPVKVFDPTTILSLNSLTCPSSTECVAVGASLEHRGVAIVGHLHAGSWNWSLPITMANENGGSNPPTVSLNSVACVSVDVCLAVGTDLSNSINVTTYTLDAGNSWSPDAVAAGDGATVGDVRAQLNSVSCNSTVSCVAVGSDATGYGEVTYASFANDTWTWSAKATQLDGDGHGGALNAIDCFDPTTCVAVGADTSHWGVSAVATMSGAQWSWSAENAILTDATGTGQLFTLTCTGSGVCEALGADSAANSVVTRSTDGGADWAAESPIAGDGATGTVAGNDPASVACPTTSRCLSVGSDALGRAFVTVSSNAGQTWGRETLFNVAALPGEGPLSAVSCSGALCVAVGTNDANESVVSRSVDSGRTWVAERQLTPDASGASYVQSVDCVGKDLCVAVGWDNLSRPIFTHSTNGGRSWSKEQTIGVDFSSEGFLDHVDCASSHRCVAVGWDGRGQAVTAYSLDGGAAWSPERTVNADATGTGFLYAVTCPRTTYCVAVGRDDQFKGVAAYSWNGGVGWSSMTPLVSVTRGTGALDAVSCPNPQFCVAVGGTGTGAGASVTSRSTNGGKTWTPEATVSLDSTMFGLLNSVTCPTVTLCVAGGTDGFEQAVTTYSLNRGLSWSREATTTSLAHKDFFTAVSCSSIVKCVAVGADSAQRGVVVPIRFPATVRFVAHGGRGVMRAQTAWSAQRLHAVGFTRSGYRFAGWSQRVGGPVVEVNRQRYNFLADATLYAVWQRG